MSSGSRYAELATRCLVLAIASRLWGCGGGTDGGIDAAAGRGGSAGGAGGRGGAGGSAAGVAGRGGSSGGDAG